MTKLKMYAIVFVCALLLPTEVCAKAIKEEGPRFSQTRYTNTVHLNPQDPSGSQRLELAMSLVQMNYPAEQARFFNKVLYSADNPDEYRDQVMHGQRDNYISNISALEDPSILGGAVFNWEYSESITVMNSEYRGIVAARELYTYTGGAHGLLTKQYYVLDLDSLKLVTIGDLFDNFRDLRIRAIIYDALRDYSGLAAAQPLSEGFFFDDEPELSDNFFVTQEGLGLRWDPYDIAPYSVGGIEIVIPWRNVRPLMLHSGMELLVKFNIYLFM
jgi:hypothetical protein